MKILLDDLRLLSQVLLWGFAVYGAVMGYVNFKIHQALKEYLESKGLGE